MITVKASDKTDWPHAWAALPIVCLSPPLPPRCDDGQGPAPRVTTVGLECVMWHQGGEPADVSHTQVQRAAKRRVQDSWNIGDIYNNTDFHLPKRYFNRKWRSEDQYLISSSLKNCDILCRRFLAIFTAPVSVKDSIYSFYSYLCSWWGYTRSGNNWISS